MLKEIGWEYVECINLAHDTDQVAGHCERGNEPF